jgi:hypothetical protein
VTVPFDVSDDTDFAGTVAATLATMSHEGVPEMQTVVKKSNQKQLEERDTVKPFIVKNFFLAMLRAAGGGQGQVPGFWKSTREEVMWSNGNKLSWHRSPVWLFFRVVLEQTLSPPLVGEHGEDHGLYKRFMIFSMSKIMDQALDAGVSSDTLCIMNAKLAQRLIKLDSGQHEPWLAFVKRAVQLTTLELERRWREIIKANTTMLRIPTFDAVHTTRDLRIAITQLDNYLEAASRRKARPSANFHPNTPDIRRVEGDDMPERLLSPSSPLYHLYNLISFEEWVANRLSVWQEKREGQPDVCARIRKIMRAYDEQTRTVYQGQPEGMSIKYLTIIELWIACGKAAIQCCRLIADYQPEIPVVLLRSLLLKSAADMKRLHRAERYLECRTRQAKSSMSILFGLEPKMTFGFGSLICPMLTSAYGGISKTWLPKKDRPSARSFKVCNRVTII